ncbi:MATE family efflux transporter [Bacillus kexueae]|uniref:MATE family efflux transporter n=1 Tax=Aeribacillus kexueae TaxID=2078952 RepID=UPI001FAEE072|nr:MATE family efflux transporter [Bacillus kexueae]
MNHRPNQRMNLFALTWPIFIEILLHMVMGNADTLMLSQYSDHSVAAVGVSNQILFVLIVMFGFIATGTAILVAQYLGANKQADAVNVSTVSIFANFLFSLLLSLVVFFASAPLLHMMNIPVELFGEANLYLKLVGVFSFVQALFMTMGAVLRSYGYTKDTMYVTIFMNVLNVIGNYLLIFGPFGIPVLGVTGVAISTVVSRIIGFIILFILLKKRISIRWSWSIIIPLPLKHLRDILKIGIPSAGEHLAYNLSQMAILYFITMMGTEAITTKIYAQNIMMFIFLFSIALSQGTQIIVGHLVGAKQFEEAYERCMKSLKIAMVASVAIAVVMSIFSHQLLAIFTDNEDIIALGSTLIFLTIILEPGRAFNLVIINSLRATGDVVFPTYMGILSMWGISVTISYLFGIHLGFGLVGVWISFIADEWLRGLIMLWRWRSRVWINKSFVGKKVEAI